MILLCRRLHFRVRNPIDIRYLSSYKKDSRRLVRIDSDPRHFIVKPTGHSSFRSVINRYFTVPICRYLLNSLNKQNQSPKIHIFNVKRVLPNQKERLQPSFIRFILQLAVNKFFNTLFKRRTKHLYYQMEVSKASVESMQFDTSPPESVRGMTTLNRDAFQKRVNMAGVLVPKHHLKNIQKAMKKMSTSDLRIKTLVELGGDDPLSLTHKILLLDPCVVKTNSDLPEHVVERLKECEVNVDTLTYYDLDLKYENWNYSDILKAVLPVESEGVGGFSIVGHIVQLNLRDELLPYKNLIGNMFMNTMTHLACQPSF